MAERISWTNRDSLGVMLSNAMAEVAVGQDFFETFKLDVKDPDNAGAVNVVVTANGVEIPFKDEMRRTLDCLEEKFNEAVLECAKRLLGGSRLRDLADKLDRIEWGIEREIEREIERAANLHKQN